MIPQPHVIENAGCAVPAAPESPRISASVPRGARKLGHVPVPCREVLANWVPSRFGQPPCSKTRACPSIVLSGARELGHVPVEKGYLLANRVMSPLKRARKLGHGPILERGGWPIWDMAGFLSGAAGQTGTWPIFGAGWLAGRSAGRSANLGRAAICERNPRGHAARHEKRPPGEKPDGQHVLVETMGLEPTASGLQSPRSPS